MTSFDNIVREVKQERFTSELYRFQGAKSFECFDIRTSRFNKNQNPNYVFFSSSLDHHKYFTAKRLRQLINRQVLKDSPYQLSQKSLGSTESYSRIRNIVLNSEKIQDLHSIRLVCDQSFKELIISNWYQQSRRYSNKPIERVDARVYGGGYGIAQEWQELLSYLTYFAAYRRINREDVADYLSNMRRSCKILRKENLDFLLEEDESYNYTLNPHLESDFTRFYIRNALELIVGKHLYLEGSPLAENPERVIKQVVSDYEYGKDKVLQKITNYSNKNNNQ